MCGRVTASPRCCVSNRDCVSLRLLYAQVPPPGPLVAFGTYYRPVMSTACVVMTVLVRYGVVGITCAVCRAVGVKGWPPLPAHHSTADRKTSMSSSLLRLPQQLLAAISDM